MYPGIKLSENPGYHYIVRIRKFCKCDKISFDFGSFREAKKSIGEASWRQASKQGLSILADFGNSLVVSRSCNDGQNRNQMF